MAAIGRSAALQFAYICVSRTKITAINKTRLSSVNAVIKRILQMTATGMNAASERFGPSVRGLSFCDN